MLAPRLLWLAAACLVVAAFVAVGDDSPPDRRRGASP